MSFSGGLKLEGSESHLKKPQNTEDAGLDTMEGAKGLSLAKTDTTRPRKGQPGVGKKIPPGALKKIPPGAARNIPPGSTRNIPYGMAGNIPPGASWNSDPTATQNRSRGSQSGQRSTKQSTHNLNRPVNHVSFDLPPRKKRGRILYGTQGKTSLVYIIALFGFLMLPLTFYNPVFINLLILTFVIGIYHYLYVPDENIVVYEKGIYIPISRHQVMNYNKLHLPYTAFVPFSKIQFFYPRSFNLYRGILIPHGLTIKTTYLEYHVPHEFARVLSKKLRVALKDDFSNLYKGKYCIYIKKDNWDEIEKQIKRYPEVFIRSIILTIAIFAGIIGFTAYLSWSAGYPLLSLPSELLWTIVIDSVILTFYFSRNMIRGLFRKFYNAIFKTWLSMQKDEKVPMNVDRAFKKYVKRKITREADVLEIFDLDRKERSTISAFINIAVLIQVILIVSILPEDLLVEHEVDYSNSDKVFPMDIRDIDEYTIIENSEIYQHTIIVDDETLIIRNSTIYGLGGTILDVRSDAKLVVENSSILTPDMAGAYRSEGNNNINHFIMRQVNIPINSSLSFITKYSMDYGFDFGYVEASKDGENWTRLKGELTTKSRNVDADVGYKRSHALTGTRNWEEERMDLKKFAGDVTLRFSHHTDDHKTVANGEWSVWNIKILSDKGTIDLSNGWQTYGWTKENTTKPSMDLRINGDTEFSNVDFNFNNNLDSSGIVTFRSDVTFNNCRIDNHDGYAIWFQDSTGVLENTFIESDKGIGIENSNINVSKSFVRALGASKPFYLDDSYVILQNTTIMSGESIMSPGQIYMIGDSGVAALKNVDLSIRSLDLNGNSSASQPVLLESLNSNRIIQGTTNEFGNFSTYLYGGYELYGSGVPFELFDDLLIKKTDTFKITVGSHVSHKFIGDDLSLDVVSDPAPDLQAILSTCSIDDVNSSTMNVSFTLKNAGDLDANGFTVEFYDPVENKYVRNISLATGEEINLYTEWNSETSSPINVKIDKYNEIQEKLEDNNHLTFRNNSWKSEPSSISAEGSYVVDDLHSNLSMQVTGDLMIDGGSIDFTRSQGYQTELTVYGDLIIRNATDEKVIPDPISQSQNRTSVRSFGNTYLLGSSLSRTDLDFGGTSKIMDSTLSNMEITNENAALIDGCALSEVQATSYSNQVMIIENNVLRSCEIAGVNMLVRDNQITQSNGIFGLKIIEGYILVIKNRISESPIGIWVNRDTQYTGQDVVGSIRENIIDSCEIGLKLMNQEMEIKNNNIKQCDIGVHFTSTSYVKHVFDIVDENVLDNCTRQLEYYHIVSISFYARNDKYLRTELYEMWNDDLIDSFTFTAIIENDTETFYENTEVDSKFISLNLLHFYVDGSGIEIYPEYDIRVFKDFYGYHYSTFSDLSNMLRITVGKNGDSVIKKMDIQPGEDERINLNITVSAIGLNVTDVKVVVYRGEEEITSRKFPEISANGDSFLLVEIPIEPGLQTYTAKITSDDIYSGNNDLIKRVSVFSGTETRTGADIGHSIIVSSGGDLTIESGSIYYNQSWDNEFELIVLGNGTLTLKDVDLNSNHLYELVNYGNLICTNTVFHNPGSDRSIELEDEIVKTGNGNDNTLRLNSGIINHGDLTLNDCTIEGGSIFSDNDLTMKDTFMNGGMLGDGSGINWFPYPAIMASGNVDISDSNISYYANNVYFYNAEFSVKNTDFLYGSPLFEDLEIGHGWAFQTGGVFALKSNGIFIECTFMGIGLDLRNSSVDITLCDFTTREILGNYPLSSPIIIRNGQGSIMDNDMIFSGSYHSLSTTLLLKYSSEIEISRNLFSFEGSRAGIGIRSFWSTIDIHENEFQGAEYGIISYGTEITSANNTYNNSYVADHSHKWLLNLSAEDGSGHMIHDINAVIDGEVVFYHNLDGLYFQDPWIFINYQQRIFIQAWMEGYHLKDGNLTVNEGYRIRIYKDLVSKYVTINMSENVDHRVVLNMPELGIELKIPSSYRIGDSGELVITVYNNGSRTAYDITIKYTIDPKDNSEKRITESFEVPKLDANSSIDIPLFWVPESRSNEVELQVMIMGAEATTSNNEFLMTVKARKEKEPDTVDATFRGFVLFLSVLGFMIFGYLSMNRQYKEKKDAMGINFDAEEFRKSLQLVGTEGTDDVFVLDEEIPGGDDFEESGPDARDTSSEQGSFAEGSLTEDGAFTEDDGFSDADTFLSDGRQVPVQPEDEELIIQTGEWDQLAEDSVKLEDDELSSDAEVFVEEESVGGAYGGAKKDPRGIPGKNICPVCKALLNEPDASGFVSCELCGWLKFQKSLKSPEVHAEIEEENMEFSE